MAAGLKYGQQLADMALETNVAVDHGLEVVAHGLEAADHEEGTADGPAQGEAAAGPDRVAVLEEDATDQKTDQPVLDVRLKRLRVNQHHRRWEASHSCATSQ